jgi:hypothetical protein
MRCPINDTRRGQIARRCCPLTADNRGVSDFRYPLPDPDAPPPDPDLSRLIAQFGASAHKLRFSLMSSVRPLDGEEVRKLAHGTLAGVAALQSVMPSTFTEQIEQARALLSEAVQGLETS